jgi:hypothetical protein
MKGSFHEIVLVSEIFAKLEAAKLAVGHHELSGLGFVNVNKQGGEITFEVYDVVLLDVGSSSFTEIPAERILPLLDRLDASQMKLWWHAHPLGNDQPGAHNWSSMDNYTATQAPLGGVPELVKWSLSMVRTPRAWVGRFDRYQDGVVETRHIPVLFCHDQSFINQAKSFKAAYEDRLEQMQKELAVTASPFGLQDFKIFRWFSTHPKKGATKRKKRSIIGLKGKK